MMVHGNTDVATLPAETDAPGSTDARLADCLARLEPLHQHLCPRQVLGVRIGLQAADLLGTPALQADKRLLALVETDGCFADGVGVATGCWLGHRTLRLMDYGKVAATLVDTTTGRAVRVRPRRRARARADRYASGAPDPWHAQLAAYQVMPSEALLRAEWVSLGRSLPELLGQAGVRIACQRCGEEILNGREVVVGAEVVCRGCTGIGPFSPGKLVSA
jgi:formylmethanofuran dehydrogenase subunit E